MNGCYSEPRVARPAWFCLRSHPKHEHIAAANLRRLEGVEVFSPRLRLKRPTVRGAVWFTEALFPNYLFARFDLEEMLDRVRHTTGVSTVVSFGNRCPVIEAGVIDELRLCMGGADLKVLSDELAEGEPVEVVGGAFAGMQAVVLRVTSATRRVQVLLDLLGRSAAVELPLDCVLAASRRTECFGRNVGC
jgi:transcriptional antiterminator RfaH